MPIDEASNILRRFGRVVTQLDRSTMGYLTKAARTLDPDDIRRLAAEVREAAVRRSHESGLVAIVIRHGDPPRVRTLTHAAELRGLARSIIRYGGPDAVKRDADPRLVEWVNSIGWSQ